MNVFFTVGADPCVRPNAQSKPFPGRHTGLPLQWDNLNKKNQNVIFAANSTVNGRM